ncbi:alpha-E domain-containing protein [Acidiphilium acidophilum]|uniref:alpha-E domain-containing protein n=1 Tax=Acidiphilium acidophilum TaxID=76588 RepID=UPI002E8E6A0A|nr:alpha-E domain-containing protein [Acidiphilium acidophilum]
MRVEPVLLARDAEGLFWMARYLERVENLARLIDVVQSFESPGREAESWTALVAIMSDQHKFESYDAASDPDAVKRLYLLDPTNPTGIPFCLDNARTNARTLRPLISTEMWRQINVFHRFVMRIDTGDLDGDRLSRLCTKIKESVQTHTGITEGTMYRDQGWQFYQLGRLVERADQTTRLLDIKYRLLVPRDREARRVTELTMWNAVLRAAAGYHAFKRLARAEFSAEDVAGFLLRDPSFPRSVCLSVRRAESHLDELRRIHHLPHTSGPIEQAEYLREFLLDRPMSDVLEGDLHDYLDRVQIQLSELAGSIGRAFFRDWKPEPAGVAAPLQSQTM